MESSSATFKGHPNMIDKIKVQNYKSLENVEVELAPLTVFVGPNNAGKSNLLDSLQLFRDLLHDGPGAIEARGGFRHVVWNGETKRTITFQIDGHFDKNSGLSESIQYQYKSALVGGATHFRISSESFDVSRPIPEQRFEQVTEIERALNKTGAQNLLEFPSGEGNSAVIRDVYGKMITGHSAPNDELRLRFFSDISRYPMLGHFSKEVREWAFYSLVPSRMTNPVRVKKGFRILPEGDNTSAVLHSIHSEHIDKFNQIEEIMKTAVQEITEIVTALTEQGETYLNIREKHLNIRIPSWAMSDGTLRLLAHLAIIFSPQCPSLVCFEEPENFVHPHMVELLANALKKASEKTQILLTTHSPYLLNHFEPESLIIVEKLEGKTSLAQAKDIKGIKEALRKLGLGEIWYTGSLGGVPE
jgi:predicted ATPase